VATEYFVLNLSIYLHLLGMKDYNNALPFQWNIKKKSRCKFYLVYNMDTNYIILEWSSRFDQQKM
jgi:hypothetical protein